MSKERLLPGDYLIILLLIALFVVLSLVYQVNQKFSFDQVQMLLKGFHAVQTGEYLPFGNEASTMGNLPGMISSWVIGFPLKLINTAFAPVVFLLVLRIIGIILYINALTLLFSRKIVLIGIFLLALSPWMLYQSMLYNPAYLLFGSALALNCLVRLRRVKNSDRGLLHHHHTPFELGRFLSSFFLVLAIGFCLQLHFSWPVLAATTGILYLRRDIKVSYSGIILGLAVVALSLWPYVTEVMHNPTLLTNPEPYAQERYLGYGLVHVYPVFKGLLYWLRFGSLLVTEKAVVPEIMDDWSMGLTVAAYGWIGLSYLVGGITVLYAAYSNFFVITRFRAANSSDKLQFVRALAISALLAVLLAAAASPVTLNFWQIAVVIPFALLPVLAFMSVRPQGLKLYVIVAALFFVVANILASFYSEKFNYHENFRANFYSTCMTGFEQAQCAVYASGISPEMLQQINAAHPEPDAGVVHRVIEGIIPDPAITAAQQAAAAEAAAAEAAASAAAASASSAVATASAEAAPEAEAAGESADTATAATSELAPDSNAAATTPEPAASAAATAAEDADSTDAEAEAEAETETAAAANEVPVAKQPQAIVNVAPASAPLNLPPPALNTAPPDDNAENTTNTNNTNPNPAPATHGIIVDQGQGASGELLIQ